MERVGRLLGASKIARAWVAMAFAGLGAATVTGCAATEEPVPVAIDANHVTALGEDVASDDAVGQNCAFEDGAPLPDGTYLVVGTAAADPSDPFREQSIRVKPATGDATAESATVVCQSITGTVKAGQHIDTYRTTIASR
jgi:hypothetical protein